MARGSGRHTFYFRERDDAWRIEFDLRPSGRRVRAFVGTDLDDEASYEERGLDEGDVIAYGTTDVEGYETTRVERAKFIVDTIRVHLAREACRLHAEDLSSIEALLGREVRWCALADEGPRVYQMIHSVCERDQGSARTCWADAGGTR